MVANQLAAVGRPGSRRRRGWPSRSGPAGRPAGAPGCGWRSGTTAAPGFTATTAPSWSPICAAHSCLPACSTDRRRSTAGRVGDQLHVVRRRRRAAPRGEQRPEGRRHPGRRGRLRGRAAGGDRRGGCRSPRSGRHTATPPRVYSALIADWAEPSAVVDGVGPLRRRRRVRRGARRRRGGVAGRSSPSTPRGPRRARRGRRWPTCRRSRRHRFGTSGAGVAQPPNAPTSRCLIRRAPAPAATSSTCSPAPVCRGSIHIGCEAASFARDIGLYRGHGYTVETCGCSTRSR